MSILVHNLQLISLLRNEARKMDMQEFSVVSFHKDTINNLKFDKNEYDLSSKALSDLDRAALELASLVEGLKAQAKILDE